MNERKRIDLLDIAKAYGIALVVYGHFLLNVPTSAAAIQAKCVYSFHMPLFFILAGYVAATSVVLDRAFVGRRIAVRLVPVIIFNLLGFAVSLSFHCLSGSPEWRDYLRAFELMLIGHPAYNITTWFLVCLFTVEIIHSIVCRFTGTRGNLLVSTTAFLVMGWLVTRNIEQFGRFRNVWYINEAVVAYGLYQLGILLKRSRWLESQQPLSSRRLFLFLSVLILVSTCNLNALVLMMHSIHGNYLLFLVTSVCGSYFILSLASFTPSNRIVMFVGQNTLLYFLLDGLFRPLVIRMFALLQRDLRLESQYTVLAVGSVVAVGCLAAWTPLVICISKFCPVCAGRGFQKKRAAT